MCELKDFQHLRLCYLHRGNLQQELASWHKWYLPIESSQLDGGAGCGETVQFYLNHGAKKVLAIEADDNCFENLKHNFGNDERVTLVKFVIGSMKFDIEGAERNMIFAAHFPIKVRRLWGSPVSPEAGYIVIEDWGNVLSKARRKIGSYLVK